jgi:hypothetical protein
MESIKKVKSSVAEYKHQVILIWSVAGFVGFFSEQLSTNQ